MLYGNFQTIILIPVFLNISSLLGFGGMRGRVHVAMLCMALDSILGTAFNDTPPPGLALFSQLPGGISSPGEVKWGQYISFLQCNELCCHSDAICHQRQERH